MVHEIINMEMIMDMAIHVKMIEEVVVVVVVVVVAVVIGIIIDQDKDNEIAIKMMIIVQTVDQIDPVMEVDTVIHGKLPLEVFPFY